MSLTRFIDSPLRKFALLLTASALVAACGSDTVSSGTSSAGGTPSQGTSEYEVPGDHAVGNPNASVTVVEYASVVCPACANWHMNVYPEFKKKYVDTGKVRYIFREFPTEPATLAQAGFLIANCADDSRFLDNISMQFQRQQALMNAPDRRQAYVDLAKASGLTEAEFEECLSNQDEIDRYERVVKGGIEAGVASTPAFFINGEKVKVFTIESFDEEILPRLGEPLPSEAEE